MGRKVSRRPHAKGLRQSPTGEPMLALGQVAFREGWRPGALRDLVEREDLPVTRNDHGGLFVTSDQERTIVNRAVEVGLKTH